METTMDEMTAILDIEKRALTAVNDCTIGQLNDRVNWKQRQKKSIVQASLSTKDLRAKRFWDECTNKFTDHFCEMENLSFLVNPGSRKDGARWISPLDEFRAQYKEIGNAYFSYFREREDCDKLFEELCALLTLAEKQVPPPQPQGPLLERVGQLELGYLTSMLDLKNDYICAVLPYLLTGYVVNFWQIKLFYAKKKFCERMFGEEELGSEDIAKLRPQVAHLSSFFSLKKAKVSLMQNSTDRPSAYFDFKSKPYMKHIDLVKTVFFEWSKIVMEYTNQAGCGWLHGKIDFKKSESLFNHYIP